MEGRLDFDIGTRRLRSCENKDSRTVVPEPPRTPSGIASRAPRGKRTDAAVLGRPRRASRWPLPSVHNPTCRVSEADRALRLALGRSAAGGTTRLMVSRSAKLD